jgi:DhnA family fructose-bisphosphate aldolase class Ia
MEGMKLAISATREQIDQEYDLKGYKFATEEFLPRSLFEEMTEIRVDAPEVVLAEAETRRRRPKLTLDGKLVILAADHPGRNVTTSEGDPIRMASRLEYLGRILRVVVNAEVDGVMATPDIIDELFIANYLHKQRGGESFLDNRVLIGSMNRGGLAGASFEMDDRFTSYSPEGLADMRLDAGKLMFRLDLSSADSGKTLAYTAEAVRECGDMGIAIFVESLVGKFEGGKWSGSNAVEEMVKIVGVATALGDISTHIWLKLNYTEGYEKVAGATTCPILMLGGPSKGNPTYSMEEFEKGLKAGANVRGALCGRNILFPGDDDPQAVARAISRIVHNGDTTLEAVKFLAKVRGEKADVLAKVARRKKR